MHDQKFSKETIWAVSIIFVCILTAFFLILKMSIQKSHPDELTVINETIILPEKSVVLDTDETTASLSDSTKSEVVSTTPSMEAEEFNPPVPTDEPTSVPTETKENTYQSPIDFESLWETNEDVYAWITVPGTVIDYPILQHETDDSYYLNYTIDGVEGYPGSIYTEHVNSKDFTDNNTVIYGHNMRNGTMFTDLHKFRDIDFFAEHDTVYIYTPKRELTYKIFAAYLYDDRHLMNSFDFSDMDIYSDYLSEIQTIDSMDENANLRKDIKITDTDKIITLITCIREQPEKRVYVQAVLQP